MNHRGVYYVQSPALVHKLLDVDRYSQRWPLIPPEELHASSVQHPEHPEWRWLLHSRRVPVEAPADLGQAALLAPRLQIPLPPPRDPFWLTTTVWTRGSGG